MKKRQLFKTLILLAILLITLHLQFGRNAVINNSITTPSVGGYEAILTVTANKLVILNPRAYATALAAQVADNSFPNFMFSYDQLGYPNELNVTVYTNAFTKRLGMPAFSFRYTSDDSESYNIGEHPEQFHVILDTD